MKIRTDFVTNSSSSSFILAFKDNADIELFEESCGLYSYDEFYNLIDNLCSDFLVLYNESKESIPIRMLIDKIRHIDFGPLANKRLNELYEENYIIEPWDSCSIKINHFGNNKIDLNNLNFEDIEEETYSISVINNKDNRDKQKAIDDLRWQHIADYRYALLEEKFDKSNYESYKDLLSAQSEYEKTEEYKKLIEEHLKTTKFEDKKRQIEESLLIVGGTIWDTAGGLLEWSIRNGFIEDNFYRNCISCYNVG